MNKVIIGIGLMLLLFWVLPYAKVFVQGIGNTITHDFNETGIDVSSVNTTVLQQNAETLESFSWIFGIAGLLAVIVGSLAGEGKPNPIFEG